MSDPVAAGVGACLAFTIMALGAELGVHWLGFLAAPVYFGAWGALGPGLRWWRQRSAMRCRILEGGDRP